MTIIEAIKSGKPFRRLNREGDTLSKDWMSLDSNFLMFRKEDFHSTDWEVKPEKVKKSEIEQALDIIRGCSVVDAHYAGKLLQCILENGVEE